MGPRVATYMNRSVIVVSPRDTLAHARNVMLRRGISRLVVVEGEEPVGILTVSDIIDALLGRFMTRPIESILVEEVMTRDLVTIQSTKGIKMAALKMLNRKIGGLPVVDGAGRLVGIITRTDITRAFAERYKGRYKVGDIMRREVTRGSPGHSVFYVSKLVQADPSGKVVIVDGDDRPIGIIAKRDLAFLSIPFEVAASRGKDRYVKRKTRDLYRDKIVGLRIYFAPTAADIMTENPITISPEADAAQAAAIMVEEGIGALPVVDDEGRLLGILTKKEILEAVVS